MPKLRLPPLPPSHLWASMSPRVRGRKATEGGGNRELARRIVLASKPIADQFVRDLGIRKDEVVIEAYPFVGQLTRSLLAGGFDETTPEDWHQVKREQEIVGPRAGHVKRLNMGDFDYPPWEVDEAPPNPLPEGLNPDKLIQPKAVIAVEPMVAQFSRGLGFDPDEAPSSYWDYNNVKTDEELKKLNEKKGTTPIFPSLTQKNLLMCPASAFEWDVIPRILNNPFVWEKLPVHDKTKEGIEAVKRPWNAPKPPITMVATIPDTVLGDQLMSQWIASCIGQTPNDRGWLWEFGRVRLACLVNKSLYDRIMATSGETIHCKLSVMANALFHLRPLAPYHHVPDVDKQSARTETSYEAALEMVRTRKRGAIPSPPPIEKVTPTIAGDFWPHVGRLIGRPGVHKVHPDVELPRPALLGIEMVPRENPLITLEQREEWDYVLRHCFIREAQPIGEVLPTLGFGAENLIAKVVDTDENCRYAGEPVSRGTPVRQINIEQWARIVDVFAKWPFKPELLLIESGVSESRQIGTT